MAMAMSERTPFEHPGGAVPATALLIVADGAGERQAAQAAATIAGIADAACAVAATAADTLVAAALDIVLADIRSIDDETADALLAAIDTAAKGAPLRVVVVLRDAQIDLATAILFGPHVRHLCDPTMIEVATTLIEAKQARRLRAEESSRDEEPLRRLNDEVARIAETLARLTAEADASTGGGGGVRDVARGYRAAPAAEGTAGAPPVIAADVRRAIRARRMRAQYFDPALFADPAWDMLLDLFAASLEGAQVSVSSLCIAAAVPGTTALRWIGSMTEAGLFARQADPRDRRRAHVLLSDRAIAAMRGYFAGIRAAGLASA